MNVSKMKHTTIWRVFGSGLLFFYLASLVFYDLLVDTLVVTLAPWLTFLAARPRVHRQESEP